MKFLGNHDRIYQKIHEDSACARNPHLRGQLAKLLAAHALAEDFFSMDPLAATLPRAAEDPEMPPSPVLDKPPAGRANTPGPLFMPEKGIDERSAGTARNEGHRLGLCPDPSH